MTDNQVRTALALAHSDAQAERDDAISWLLAHPDLAEPVLAEDVRAGRASSPELALRLLAAFGRPGSVPAIVAALERGNAGEAFWAAQALAAHPATEAAQALRRARDHGVPAVRAAAAAALHPYGPGR